MPPRLVLPPATTFVAIDRGLAALGCARQPSTAAGASLVRGEPEFSSWIHGDGARISYTFNPVVGLRVLTCHGADAGELSARIAAILRSLDVRDIRDLLHSDDVRQLLLGIFAAREFADGRLAPDVDALRIHPDARVAAAATQATSELVAPGVEAGLHHLARERARHPDRSTLFPHLGDAAQRRQVLRWMIHDCPRPTFEVLEVLRAAVVDVDWEARASAMLLAARIGAGDLWDAIRRIDLPKVSRHGPDRADRDVLFSCRRVVLDVLAGKQSADPVAEFLRRCILGTPPEPRDRASLLIHALTEPLAPQSAPPEISAVIEENGRYRLRRSGIELCWVDAAPHWLGSGESDLASAYPIRRHTPATGFFAACLPARESAPASLSDARRFCAAFSQAEGAAIDLPTADEWEMAARGTDGRRFPWGNGLVRDPSREASPYGLRRLASGDSAWTRDGTACGGARDPRCAARRIVPPGSLLVIRPILTVGGPLAD